MKKPTKSIITSSLLALAFGAMSVGTTFALFTSQAETTINVGSGVVNVESSASLARYESSVDHSDVNLTGLTTYSNELVGNQFSLEGSTVTIDKMVPGDSLTLKLSAHNKSNVKTKTRYVVNHSVVGTKTDLYPALEFTFSAGNLSEVDLFKWRVNEPVADITTGVALYNDLSVTITFPDGDNGQILFGSANHDNQYQDAACSIAFSLQAVQANAATSPIDEINAYLEVEKMLGHENFTMHDAVLDMAAIDYTDLSVLEGYVYDLVNDQFVKESSVTANKVDYFKVYESMEEEQSFSIYAVGSNWTTVSGLEVGFDAGDTTGITSITYDRNDAEEGQEVTIRTNTAQTTLTIDAPLDTIHHYDALGALNIIEAATASYHEFGSIAYAEIAKGRIVLEEGSKVNEIHVNKKAAEQAFDTVIIANNGGAEELPERITRDAVEVSSQTLVVKVESNGSSENVYVYAEGQKGSTEKVTEGENKQNENVESALGQLVLDNGANPGEKAQTAEEKAEAKDEVASEAVSANFEKQEGNGDYVARIGQTGYMSLQAAVEAAVNGNTVHLLKNVSFTSADYLLINKDLTLNLSDKSITGSHDPMIVIGASVGNYQPTSSQLTHTGHLAIKGEGSITSINWDMICIFPDAVLDVYGGNYTGFKATFYINGGTLNTYAGNFTATSPSNTYIVQVKGAGIANIYGGNFTTPVNGGYGVYLDNASVSNFGSTNGEGPTFNTWRACIASNGSESHAVLANIYSGTYHSYRSDSKPGEQSVIQLANNTSETQTLNIYGGTFEQTGSNEDRSIFNVRYSGTININISGGKFVPTSINRLFNGVCSGNGSSSPSAENVHVTVTNNAISTGTQNVKVYNYSTDAHVPEKDYEFVIE